MEVKKFLQAYFALFLVVFFISFLSLPVSAKASTLVDTDITADTIWTTSGDPYIISGPISISEQATLTISKGVIVKFLDPLSSLTVSGALLAQGTKNKPIYFTSYQDDTIGGDTNHDYQDSLPYPGDWDGIVFDNTGTSSSLLNVKITYAENGVTVWGAHLVGENISCLNTNGCFNVSNGELSINGFLSEGVSGTIFNLYQSSLSLGQALIHNIEISLNPFAQYIIDGYASNVSLNNVTIGTVPDPVNGITLFSGSSFQASNLTFDSQSSRDAITIFNDSTISLTDTVIKKTTPGFYESGLLFFNHAEAVLTNVKVNGFGNTGIYDLGSQSGFGSNVLSMNRVEVDHNNIGFGVDDGLVTHVTDVSVHNNGYALFAYTDVPVEFKNVWWGSESGPNYTTTPTGSNNEVFGLIDYTPWATIDPFNPVPTQYFAKITSIPGGVAKLYESPSISGILVKTLPNDWVVKVIQRTLDNGQPAISDGYRWYKVEDPTDGSQMWMFAGPEIGAGSPFLPYDSSLQQNLQHISSDILNTKALRREAILEAVDHYYNDTSTNPSLYSSDDSQTISLLKQINMPKEVLLAIISQESGIVNFDNENVSYDYGHGAMQITFKAWSNENTAKGYSYKNNDWDNRGAMSLVTLSKCKNWDKNISGIQKGVNDYERCYENAGGYNKLLKPYKNYEDISTNPRYKQYTNTVQSFYANIKDGLGDLSKKFNLTRSCPHSSFTIESLTFSCEDVQKILMVWAYNGLGFDKKTNQYTGTYLHDISQKLASLNKNFSGINYSNTDQLIEKLEVANKNRKTIKVYSPVKLKVTDSEGDITGINDGLAVVDIPNSVYDADAEAVTILFPEDTYAYQVVGDSQGGSYGLSVESLNNNVKINFLATDIPITTGEIHTYHIDEAALASGEDGVMVDIDKNGDGIPERTVMAGPKLTSLSYQFDGFKPLLDGKTFKKNKSLNIKFRVKSKNGILVPLLHPTLSIVRISDGFHADVNPSTFEEDPDCDPDDNCFKGNHNRYRYILPGSTLTPGTWKVTVGLDDGSSYSAVINIIN